MDPETRAWCFFCAAVFLWMGVSLALGAAVHAESALAWMAAEGKPAPGQRRRLAFFYRLGGAFFAGFGLWLFVQAFQDPSALAAFLPRSGLGRGGRIAAGAGFLLGGSLLAAAKAAAGLRRGGAGSWEAEPGLAAPQEPVLEKARRAWGWVIVLALLAFGAYLLRGAAAA
ncbi:MAG: hypothetical protein PHU21_12295 [Elusimicrobia bacterium]|jgi:hypothetical protein|nr:hypothetical protein [Elusimicrobiota bacterium]